MRCLLIFILALLFLKGRSQSITEKDLYKNLVHSSSDSERVIKLGELAQYYYNLADDEKGDSMLDRQLMLAEETRNPDLILNALFFNSRFVNDNIITKPNAERKIPYILKALQCARAENNDAYAALAYAKLAMVYNVLGQSEEATKNGQIGFTLAASTTNDSIKTICALQFGNSFVLKGDLLTGFKIYSNALDFATNSGNEKLISQVYQYLSNFYKKLGDDENARDLVYKSLELNKKNNNIQGQIEDCILLAKLSEYKEGMNYLQRAEELSDSIGTFRYKLEAEHIIFNHMILKEPSVISLEYLEQHPQLKSYYKNSGSEYLDWMIGEVYLYTKQYDTALYYFTRAKPGFENNYDLNTKKAFLLELSNATELSGNIVLAVKYYLETLSVAKSTSDLYDIRDIMQSLKNLLQRQNDYKQAFTYAEEYEKYKDSANRLSTAKELVSMQIENEKKQHLKELELAEAAERRKHSLQYMAITIVVATVFTLLITLGMFRVSTFTIRILGFFAFIFLFEFLIMLLDKFIYRLSGGEPLKVWLIKIALISSIFPIQHFIEEKLIHYLLSRKLIAFRNKFSWKKIMKLPKKPEAIEAAEGEILPAAEES